MDDDIIPRKTWLAEALKLSKEHHNALIGYNSRSLKTIMFNKEEKMLNWADQGRSARAYTHTHAHTHTHTEWGKSPGYVDFVGHLWFLKTHFLRV